MASPDNSSAAHSRKHCPPGSVAHGLALVAKQCSIKLPNAHAHGPQHSILRGVNSQDNVCQLVTAWPQKALCYSQVAVSESCPAIFPPFNPTLSFHAASRGACQLTRGNARLVLKIGVI